MRINTVVKISLFALLTVFALHAALRSLVYAETITVAMNDDGFTPREVRIARNDTIVFFNNDNLPRWPASNLHPTHTIYPEFDPKKPIAPGQSWTFVFNNAGTWKYHDHLLPHFRGTITVGNGEPLQPGGNQTNYLEEIFSSLKRLLLHFSFSFLPKQYSPTPPTTTTKGLRGLSEKEQLRILKSVIRESGVETAWQLVMETYTKGDPDASAHDLAHFVGTKIYEEKGSSGLGTCSASFAYGCYHGFTEAAFASSLDTLPLLEKGCETVGKLHSGPWASCIHGIGHGVATHFDTANLQKALNACDRLMYGHSYCFDGVFMEFALNAPRSVYGTSLNPLYPCTNVKERHKPGCARQHPIVLRRFFGMNLKNIASLCLKAEHTIRYFCIDAIGLTIGQDSGGNPNRIDEGCSVITEPADQAQCVSAAAGEIVFQKYEGWETKAFEACKQLSSNFRSQCKKRVEQVITSYPR